MDFSDKFYSKRRSIISECKDFLKEIFRDFISKHIKQFAITAETSKQISKVIKLSEAKKKFLESKVSFLAKKRKIKFYLQISKSEIFELTIDNVENLNCELALLKLLMAIFNANILKLLEEYKNGDDLDHSYSQIIEQTILTFISPNDYQVSKKILSVFKSWLSKTYEGNPVDFCIGVINKDKNETFNNDFFNFLNSKYSATISSPNSAILLCDTNGKFVKYSSFKENSCSFSLPDDCKDLIQSTSKKYNVSLYFILTKTKEIYVINSKAELKALYRSNKWQYISSNSFYYLLYKCINKLGYNNTIPEEMHNNDFFNKIFSVTIDASLKRGGAILALIKDDKTFIEKENINNEDNLLIPSDSIKKSIVLSMLESNKENSFINTPNNTLCELLSMDGCTCVSNKNRNVIVSGLILNNVQQVNGQGGRGAAACALSKYGPSLKISEDGAITLYYKEKTIYELK